MIKKTVLYITITLLLTGCATSSETYTSEGKQGFSINCSGAVLNWGLCEQKAGEMCGNKGYEILSKNGENIGNITSMNSSSSASARLSRYGIHNEASYNDSSQTNLFSTPIVNRTMLIACKKP